MNTGVEGAGGAIEAIQLNRAAGYHPVTRDPREIEAARRAGERSLEEFPYFRHRYGERGRAFGVSDGAWLASLCDLSGDDFVDREIGWLAGVLGARGMPSLLLERHLVFLAEELERAVPERRDRYQTLVRAAARMRRARLSILAQVEAAELVRSFGERADPESLATLPRMGEILASAAVDEAAGAESAVSSVLAWVADPDRFTARWIDAVEQTVREARDLAARRAGREAPTS
jgi:hypothetical protein